MPSHYRAFISYSHRDKKWAQWLHRKIEGFRTPQNLVGTEGYSGKVPASLSPVFKDREDLESSHDLSSRVNAALESSDHLIVICSPDAAKSQWVNQEIEYYKKLGRSELIHCIIVDGDPAKVEEAADPFPPALRDRYNAAGYRVDGEAEPIAADIRKVADGKQLALLKVLAGILGVGLDDLRRREALRRQRRLLALTAVSLVITGLMVVLAISAVLAQKQAERKRNQAEDLISFMVGDLRDRLQPVGRLDALDGVGEKVLAYFSDLTEAELTAESMITRATALRQIGEVRVAQGRRGDALIAFHQALDVLNNSSGGEEAIRLFELGQINFWIADAYFKELEVEPARKHIEKYLDISRQLVQLEPDNLDYQLELLYAESNLGTLAYRSGNAIAAREYFNNALAMGRQLVDKYPGQNNDVELAITISWLGAIEASEGNYSAAIDWYKEALEVHRRLATIDKDPLRRDEIGRALWLLADVYQSAGRLEPAIIMLDESVKLYRELSEFDPQKFEWHRALAWSLTLRARDGYALKISTADEAKAILAVAAETLRRTNSDEGAETTRVSAATAIELARIALIEGDLESAGNLLSAAVLQLQPHSTKADRVRVMPLYARALYLKAETAQAKGHQDESERVAESAWREINLQEDDPIEIHAYCALLKQMSGAEDALATLSTVAKTQYSAPVYVPNSDAGQWFQENIFDN